MDLKENGWDIHCWLEDAEGNVYDHIQKNWLAFNPGFKVFRFEGLSKEELKEFNMEYIAYDEIVCKCFEKLKCNKITIVHWN